MKSKTAVPSKTGQSNGGPQGYPHPALRTDPDLPKERAEQAEVAGRHKNTGQKDHKGAR